MPSLTATRKKRRWTEEEDKILINIVKNVIQNDEKMSSAWTLSSKILGRKESSCQFRWYGVLSPSNTEKSKYIDQENDPDVKSFNKVIENLEDENKRLKDKIYEYERLIVCYRDIRNLIYQHKDIVDQLLERYNDDNR